MKKVAFLVAAIFALSVFATGCAMVANSPVMGTIYTGVKAPITATGFDKDGKKGEASCKTILGIIAWGDCSIDTAAKNGKIEAVSKVDFDGFSILGIYARQTTIVYGK